MKEYVEKAAVISIIKTAGFWEKKIVKSLLLV